MDRYEGFDEFVRSRGAALSRTAYLLCGSHAAAEDLLQEALAKTAIRWPQVRDGHPEAYVRKVMTNQRTAWWRRLRGREKSFADPPDRAATGVSEEQIAGRLALASALGTLSPKQRAVVVLRFYEDMSTEDTANLLGVTTGTVKRHCHEALARLRRLLPALADEETMEVTG